jgi:hypothetical protein
VIKRKGRGVLDHPLSRVMTSYCSAAVAFLVRDQSGLRSSGSPARIRAASFTLSQNSK